MVISSKGTLGCRLDNDFWLSKNALFNQQDLCHDVGFRQECTFSSLSIQTLDEEGGMRNLCKILYQLVDFSLT
jgi:hypothetical protein